MKHILLFLALLTTTAGYSQSLKAFDEKNGFRSLHFGDELSSLPNAKLIEEDGETKFYEKTDENLSVGEAKLKSISYGFYKGRFYTVVISTEGLVSSRALRAALEAQYGPGSQSNKYIEKYYWFGKVAWMSYNENSIDHSSKVFMSSEAISAQKAKDKEELAKKAGSDL